MNYNLPKEYLSYSQLDLWLKNKEAYRQRYYLDGPAFENKETLFGKQVAKMLEDGVEHPVLDRVPRYEHMEHRLQLKVGGVPFLGVIDSFSTRRKAIREYKTGKTPWDILRVRRHDQLVVYSLLAKLKYKKVDPWVELIWIETRWGTTVDTIGSRTMEVEANQLEFTGKVQKFRRRIAEWERKAMVEKIKRVALEISEDYTNFQKTL